MVTNIPCVYITGTAVSAGCWVYVVGHRTDSAGICFVRISSCVYVALKQLILQSLLPCSLTPQMPSCLKRSCHQHSKILWKIYAWVYIAQEFLWKKGKDTLTLNFLDFFPLDSFRVSLSFYIQSTVTITIISLLLLKRRRKGEKGFCTGALIVLLALWQMGKICQCELLYCLHGSRFLLVLSKFR